MRRVTHVVSLLLAVVTPVSAQEPPVFELEGIVVIGTPLPRAAEAMGASVTVIEGQELRQRGVTRVLDALREVPGVSIVQVGSFGALSSLFMRGGESDYVQVLMDGVQLNQPGGSFDFSGLTTESIERIEVLRGPASSLYGSDAMGGVIHIITRSGSGALRGSVAFRTGSFGRKDWTGDLTGGGERLSYGFSLSRHETDGILEFNNQFENTVLSGSVRFAPDERTLVELSSRFGGREYHFPTDFAGNVVDQNAFSFSDEVSLGLRVHRRVSDHVELETTISGYDVDGGIDDRVDSLADTLGFFALSSLDVLRRTKVDVKSHMRLGTTSLATVGVEFGRQAQRSFSESQGQFGPSSSQSEHQRWNRAAYGHIVTSSGPISFNAGGRLDDNERFGRSTSWQAAASFSYGSSGRIRAAAGRGIKEPTFFENFATGFARGNPELDPERSSSWEIGFEQGILGRAFSVSATYFDQVFEDLIQYTFSPPDPSDANFFNVARANARGVEWGATARVGEFTVSVDATWLDTEVVDSGFDEGPGATFVEGEALMRRPRTTLAGAASYQIGDRAVLNASFLRLGDRADRDFSTFPATPVTLHEYSVFDLGAEVTVVEAEGGLPGFALTVRGENLFDASYEEAFGFTAPGRGLYVGGRLTLGAR